MQRWLMEGNVEQRESEYQKKGWALSESERASKWMWGQYKRWEKTHTHTFSARKQNNESKNNK